MTSSLPASWNTRSASSHVLPTPSVQWSRASKWSGPTTRSAGRPVSTARMRPTCSRTERASTSPGCSCGGCWRRGFASAELLPRHPETALPHPSAPKHRFGLQLRTAQPGVEDGQPARPPEQRPDLRLPAGEVPRRHRCRSPSACRLAVPDRPRLRPRRSDAGSAASVAASVATRSRAFTPLVVVAGVVLTWRRGASFCDPAHAGSASRERPDGRGHRSPRRASSSKRPLRSLCVLPNPSPWPLRAGWSIRQWNVLLGLRSIGDVDIWILNEDDEARAAAFRRGLVFLPTSASGVLGSGRSDADRLNFAG